MASLHRNAFDEFDVNDDGFTSPVDALLVINELNSVGSHALAGSAPPGSFLDVSGDSIVAPVDALLVINVINDPASAERLALTEQGTFVAQGLRSVPLPAAATGPRTVRFELSTRFDAAAPGATPGDQLLVYLVDPAHPDRTLVDRGDDGTTVFSLVAGRADFAAGRARYDGRVVEIDVSDLVAGTTVGVKVQLVDADGARGSRIVARNFTASVDAGTTGEGVPASDETPATPGPAVDVSTWSATTDVAWEFSNPRYDVTTGRYRIEARARGDGAGLGRDLALVVPGLPAGATLVGASGSTSTGAPYLNFRPAIAAGGLDRGARSGAIELVIDDPSRRPLALLPQTLVGVANRPPALASITPITIRPGARLELPINATDPDGDSIRLLLGGDTSLLNVKLAGDGRLLLAPAPEQLGDHQFTLVATDGVAASSRDVTVHVVDDPLGTTRVSGRVLVTTGEPLAGVLVQIGGVEGLTGADGRFLLDLGVDAVVATTIKIRGDLLGGTRAFPFIAEHLSLTLEHDVYRGYENQIARPIYLPVLDVANGRAINPLVDALVTTAALPGVSVFVQAGTLMNQQGSPFTGTLSITEVPVDLTPIALPEDLHPDLVVTIQPGEMVFATPAPMTFPNSAGWAPDTLMDLWSINPATGQFDDVGDMRVSADGQSIVTISGGVRNSSWHFSTASRKPPIDKTQKKCGCDCEPCEEKESTGAKEVQLPSAQIIEPPDPMGTSEDVGIPELIRPFHTVPIPSKSPAQVGSASGSLSITRYQIGYQAQGESRGTALFYDSLRADPRPIVRAGLAVNPDPDSTSRIVGRLEMSRGGTTVVAPGAVGGSQGLIGGENFFRGNPHDFLPDLALQADLTNQPTGVYRYEMQSGGRQFDGHVYSGTSDRISGETIVVNSRRSVFGAGWGLAGFEQLQVEPDGSVLIVDGGGGERFYRRTLSGTGFTYVPLDGDFSTLVRLGDGSYLHRTPELTASRFTPDGRLESVTESDGRQTRYEYGPSVRLAKIIDSVGKETRFEYQGDRVARIIDPADRTTTLEYDAAGDLVRVVDPDGVTSRYQYDAQHRLVTQTDERGSVTRYVYGFDGRMRQAVLPDGTSKRFAPLESQGLFPVELTRNPATAPTAPASVGSIRTLGPDGAVAFTQVNQAGRLLGRADDLGAENYGRNALGQVTSYVNGRGQVTFYTYDERGGVTSIEQELPGSGALVGGFAGIGETDEYVFAGRAGQVLYYDALDDLDADGVIVELLQPTGDALTGSPFGGVADRDDGPFVLKQAGEYRLRLRGASGDYRFRMLDVTNATPLVAGDVKSTTLATTDDHELLVFPINASAGRRLRIEGVGGADDRVSWELSSLDGRPVVSSATGLPLEAVLPYAGRYLLTVSKSSSASTGPVALAFQLLDTTPAAPSPRTGFGEFSGSIAAGEVDRYEFTTPGGRSIFVSSMVEDSSFSLNATLVFPNGRRISTAVDILTAAPLAFPLFEAGTYAIEIAGRQANSSGSYHLEWRDVADAADPLALDAPVDLHLLPGKTRVFSFSASAGDRQFLQYLTHQDARVFVVEMDPYGNTRNHANSDFTGTYYLLMKLGPEATPLDLSWRLDSLATATQLTVGQSLDATLTPDDPADYFRFTASAGERLYVGGPPGGGVDIERALLPPGAAPYQLSSLDAVEGFLDLPVTGEYVLAIFHRVPPLFDDAPFTVSLASPPETDAGPLVPDTRFVDQIATPGEIRSYEASLPAGRYLAWTPFGAPRVALTDQMRRFDLPLDRPFALEAVATDARLQVGGTDAVGAYEFALLSIDAAPLASTGGANQEFTLSADRTVAVLRASVAGGRRYLLQARDLVGGGFASWKAYDELGALVGTNSLGGDWEFTTVEAGEWTFVLENDEGGAAATFTPELTDVTGALPARTPTGALIAGQLEAFGERTWSFTFRAGDVVQLDRQDDFEAPFAFWTAPDDSPFYVGGDEQTALVVPVAGSYVLTLQNPYDFAADYRFRVQNLTLDATPLVAGAARTGTLPRASARDVFRFTGQAGEVVVLDGLAGNFTGPELTLLDPRGAWIDVPSDAPVRLPATGTYYVTVTGSAFSSDVDPVDYAFRLLRVDDPAQTPPITPGALVEDQFVAPSAVQLYRVSAAAGERIAFLELGLPVLAPTVLVDSLGREVPWSETDGFLLWTAPYDGEYTLALTTFVTPAPSYSFRLTKPQLDRRPLDAGGSARRTFEYDPVFHRVTREVDELGRVTLSTLDPVTGDVLAVRRVVGDVGGVDDAFVSYTYGPRGRVETITDELERVTRLTYDAADNVTQIARAAGTSNETLERLEYDAAGRLTAYVDAKGARTDFEYDVRNRLVRERRADPDGAGTQARPEKTYEYDLSDRVTRELDELGRESRWQYDSLGRLVRKIDAAGQNWTLDYDALGRPVALTDAAGGATRFTYDVRGRVVSIADPLGATTRYEYDAADDLTAVVDPLRHRSTATYDVRSRVTSRTDAAGQTEFLAYDGGDRLVSRIDVAGAVTRYAYDELDRLTSMTDPLDARTTYAYDLRGNLLSTTDPLGQITTYAYDRLDRVVATIDPLQGTSTFAYDAVGNLRTLVDSASNATSFTYDALDRVIAETNALGLSRTFAYDAAGNLLRSIDRDGRQIDYAFDLLDRLASETWVGGGNTIEYSYDALGNLLVAADATTRLTMTYDAASRRTSVDTVGSSQFPSVQLRYAYDAGDRVTSVTDAPNNVVRTRVAYVYDALDRVTSVAQTGSALSAKRVDFVYDAWGAPASIRRYRDASTTNLVASTTLAYDAAHRLVELTHQNAAGAMLDFESLDFDDAGRITRVETVDGATDYAYDALGQLTAADRTGAVATDETYAYDANGNRTSSSRHGAAYVTGPNNQLLSDGVFQYAYDGEGNLIQRTEIATGQVRELAWDYRNRLTSVTDRASAAGAVTQRVEYRYDAWNRRIAQTVTANGTTRSTYFVYDREDVLYDFTDADGPSGPAAPQLATTYLHGPAIDQVLAQESASHVVDWLLTDHLGSITDLVSAAGTVVNHVSYDAYGAVLAQSNPSHATRYGFTGRERDGETGLMYYRERWYDPATGRFASEDPIGFAGGQANLYAYVAANPVGAVDPWGLKGRSAQPEKCDESERDREREYEERLRRARELIQEARRLEKIAQNWERLRDQIGNSEMEPEDSIPTYQKYKRYHDDFLLYAIERRKDADAIIKYGETRSEAMSALWLLRLW